jgi:hypothetical protein
MFWKKKQPVPPPLPLGVYPLVKAKENLSGNEEQKRKECLDLLLRVFNENVDKNTKKGWSWAYFTIINAHLAHEEFMEMLRKEGYNPSCEIVERRGSVETEYKYNVTIPKG